DALKRRPHLMVLEPSFLQFRGGALNITEVLHQQDTVRQFDGTRNVGACLCKRLQHLVLVILPGALFERAAPGGFLGHRPPVMPVENGHALAIHRVVAESALAATAEYLGGAEAATKPLV